MRRVFGQALRLLFPTWCELCGGETKDAVCAACADLLIPMEAPYCLRCAEKFDGAVGNIAHCYHCRDLKFFFEYVVVGYQMNDELRKLIHALKYKKALYLDKFLGQCLRMALFDDRLAALNLSEWVITPVPLHFTRQRQRYYNQSEVIAEKLAQEIGTPIEFLLQRTRPTQQQIRLTKSQRATNVAGAFTAEPLSAGKKVILVDDVFTTGATVNECAKQLKKQGAKRVIVVCLARK